MKIYDSYGEYEDAVRERLTYTGIEIADRLWNLFERRVRGMYGTVNGTNQKRIFASCSKEQLNRKSKGDQRTAIDKSKASLKRYQILDHLMTDSKYDFVWYFNKGTVIGGRKLLLLKFDIDCHDGEPHAEAMRTAHDLSKLFNYSYAETGTSGVGIHLYALICWDESVSNRSVIADIHEMQNLIGEKTRNHPVPCSEIKGQPLLYNSIGRIDKYGLWAKAPHPQTPDEAEELLTALELPTPSALILRRLRHADSPSQAQQNTASSITGGKRRTNMDLWGDIYVSNSLQSTEMGIQSLEELRHHGNPLGRMRYAGINYILEHQAYPSPPELVFHYESLGLHTGHAKPDRLKRAALICEQLPESFDLPKKSLPSLHKQWIDRINSMEINESEFVYVQATDSRSARRLKPEHLALVAACVEAKDGKDLAKQYLITVSRDLKHRGAIGFTLDNKKIAHAIRMLRQMGIIEIAREASTGKARKYRLLNQNKTKAA